MLDFIHPGNSSCHWHDTNFSWVLRRPLADSCFALFKICSAGLGCSAICSQREVCEDISRKCAQLWKSEFFIAEEFYSPFDSKKHLRWCYGTIFTYIKLYCIPKINSVICQLYLHFKKRKVVRIESSSSAISNNTVLHQNSACHK